MKNNKKKKSDFEEIHEYLLEEGFHEVTNEEKKEEWYKVGRETISCKFETNTDFEKLCINSKH